MQTRSAGVSPRPVAWAAQSPRPATCQGAPGLWEISRQALVGRRCRDLSRAQALLLRAPEKARDRAAALIKDAPDFSEARVLHGRASLRTSDTATALAELLPLLADDAGSVPDPAALLDGGRAALAQQDLPNAVRFYRALGSRAALLPDQDQQVVAYIEIAARCWPVAPRLSTTRWRTCAKRGVAPPAAAYSDLCATLTALALADPGTRGGSAGRFVRSCRRRRAHHFRGNDASVWLPNGMIARGFRARFRARPAGSVGEQATSFAGAKPTRAEPAR